MNNKSNYPLIGSDEKLEIIDEHRSIITSAIRGYIVYYYDQMVHRKDGAACKAGNGDKFYYWMDELIECKSDEEWQELIKYKLFW